jgi:signal transduction histidine kinase
VLVNLIDNAIKYSPDGGAIEVALTERDGGMLLTVRDEGIGLPAGATEVIFMPFGRADNAANHHIQGMGLGLAICRSIVERHGGRIWAESAGEGQGTTMLVWLPRAEEGGPDER